MFRKGDAVRVRGYSAAWDGYDFVVKSYNADADTYAVRLRSEDAVFWTAVPSEHVVSSKGDAAKTSFTIVSEWYGEHDSLGIGNQWAGSAESALVMHHAAMERARPGRDYRIVAVMPSAVYELLPRDSFKKVRWVYGTGVANVH